MSEYTYVRLGPNRDRTLPHRWAPNEHTPVGDLDGIDDCQHVLMPVGKVSSALLYGSYLRRACQQGSSVDHASQDR